MIIQFSAENFRSFKDEQTLSLVAKKRDPTLEKQIVNVKTRNVGPLELVRQVAVYGANASGKSNLIKAIRTLRRLIVESFARDPDEPLPLTPFLLDKEQASKPTVFRIQFIHASICYAYEIGATREYIVHEKLEEFVSATKRKSLFERHRPTSQMEKWHIGDIDIDQSLFTQATRGNVPFLSLCAQLNHKQLLPIFRWFKEKISIVDYSANSGPDDWSDTATEIARSPAVREFIVAVLKSSDLGIKGVDVKKVPFISGRFYRKSLPSGIRGMYEPLSRSRGYRVAFSHSSASNALEDDVMLPFEAESAGTRRLFALLAPWCKAIVHDQFLAIDEIDSSMHPAMICHLIRGFVNASSRAHAGQVLFSTHNTAILDAGVLRRDQVYFTEKLRNGATKLIPLTDYGPRLSEALQDNYLAGSYGGVPILEDFPELPEGAFPMEEPTKPSEDHPAQ